MTPFNTEKIIEHLRDITKDREQREDNYLVRIIPRKRIKSFKLVDRKSFEETEKAKYEKNRTKRINKKREGGFFPHVHLIENTHVEEVLEQLQIYK